MAVLSPVQEEFRRRLERIPAHGLGLSVDVYSPDLTSLLRALQQRQVLPAYLEIFRATPAALAAVRTLAGDGLLTCHGEGLSAALAARADAGDVDLGIGRLFLAETDLAAGNPESGTRGAGILQELTAGAALSHDLFLTRYED